MFGVFLNGQILQIALLCGPRAEYDPYTKVIRLDRKITIQAHYNNVWKFRFLLDKLFTKYMSNPQLQCNAPEKELQDILHSVLNREDEAYHLGQLETVGKKPIFLCKNYSEYVPPVQHTSSSMYNIDVSTMVPNKFNKNFNIEAFVNGVKSMDVITLKESCSDVVLKSASRRNTSGVNINQENNNSSTNNSDQSHQIPPMKINTIPYDNDPKGLANIIWEYFNWLESNEAWGISTPEAVTRELKKFQFEQWTAPKVRFFVVRPMETKNIHIAMVQNMWKFTAQTERKIFSAFQVKVLCNLYLRAVLSTGVLISLSNVR